MMHEITISMRPKTVEERKNNMQNVIKGAAFQNAKVEDGKVHPIMRLALEVCGVKMNVAVWPQKTSDSGTKYWPVSGEYDQRETRRLVDVTPVFGLCGASGPAEISSGAAPESEDLPY